MAGDPFSMWFFNEGGLIALVFIAAGLFVVQAVFTFLLWQKGDEKYLFKFISYACAAAALIIGLSLWIPVTIGEGMSQDTAIGIAAVFLIAVGVAGGLQIFLFIRDTWINKEAKA